MFTGIVKGLCPIADLQKRPGLLKYSVELPQELLEGLQIGASVSVNGVCQSVVTQAGSKVWFDAIQETLDKTTLAHLQVGERVNIERSAKFSDEIGGHILSGHVFGTARVHEILDSENNKKMTFQCPVEWTRYLFPKGYVALDGASLTLVDVDAQQGLFSVHLIPETLRVTTLGLKKQGDLMNLEFDSQTQVIVDTVERVLARKH